MKFTVSNELIESSHNADKVSRQMSSEQQKAVVAKPLDCLATAICADASSDSMKYVLRSDTGQDGE
jgi:hypothetical protein